MNAHVHPLFAGILNSFAAVPATAARIEYESALKTMDWHYEFSDDTRIRNRGKAQFARIVELQPVVDADQAMFRAHRPDAHGVPDIARPRAVVVEQVMPPIPTRDHDYRAHFDGDDEAGPQGWGETAESARADLMERAS